MQCIDLFDRDSTFPWNKKIQPCKAKQHDLHEQRNRKNTMTVRKWLYVSRSCVVWQDLWDDMIITDVTRQHRTVGLIPCGGLILVLVSRLSLFQFGPVGVESWKIITILMFCLLIRLGGASKDERSISQLFLINCFNRSSRLYNVTK